jgi:TolB-like protein
MTRTSFLALSLFGSIASTTVTAETVIQYAPQVIDARRAAVSPLDYRYEPITVRGSNSAAGSLNSAMIFLADQLERNVIFDTKTKPTIVTNIVSLTDLESSSELGRLVAEHLRHELQIRLWTVSDIRLQNRVTINAEGEFSLSRDVKKLRENIASANVLTGTYTNTEEGVLINIRILDVSTGQILSSAQTRLMKGKLVSSLVGEKPRPVPMIRLSQ